ncbi:MAG: DUF3857 domain-containing protein [Bacteroidales bacterium]
MKQFSSLFFFLIGFSSISFAKDLKYPVSAIPPVLQENAHTVIRLNQQEVEIISEKSAVVKVTEVRTILNKNGEENAIFMEQYNPLNKISNLKGRVYNEVGEVIKKVSYDEIIDRSFITGYTMFDDNRVKYINPRVGNYPYTVEYSYEVELKQTLFLPTWYHNTTNISYENSVFKVETPTGFALKFKEYNLPKGVEKLTKDGKDYYQWSLSNLKATVDEPLSSVYSIDFPMVRLVSESFAVGESVGNAKSWKGLGQWANTLIDNKDLLPEETKNKVKELTSDCKTDFEKVKKIYEYVQQKTRYVSIQVGIGGWQPFDASTVDRLSYGDCKALSNYTKALLSAAGVKSYYTLVRAGGNSQAIDTTIATSQFNHAIVCVPTAKDTIWLECTSQRLPCGFNSDFTDDRDVLLIDGDNSRLAHTRVYSAAENCVTRTVKVTIEDEESGSAEVNAKYIGLSSDKISHIYHADAADQLKYTAQRIKLPSFSLKDFKYVEHRSRTPYFDENLNLTFSNYIRKMGDNLLLTVNFMNKQTEIPDKVRNRKTDMAIRRDELETDTVIYQLPKGFVVTGLPENSNIENKFGKYSASTTQKGDKLTYIRRFELQKGVFPPQAYSEFREFLEEISTQDCAVVSLKKEVTTTTK